MSEQHAQEKELKKQAQERERVLKSRAKARLQQQEIQRKQALEIPRLMTEFGVDIKQNEGMYNTGRMEVIAVGGYGDVYITQRNQQTICVKVMLKRKVTRHDAIVEVSILKHLYPICHTHVVCYHNEFYEDDTYYYIIMEFLGNYHQLVNLEFFFNTAGEINLPVYLNVLKNAVLGLNEIHLKQVAHCDIKPTNIMYTSDGLVKYIDFGGSCYDYTCAKKLSAPVDTWHQK